MNLKLNELSASSWLNFNALIVPLMPTQLTRRMKLWERALSLGCPLPIAVELGCSAAKFGAQFGGVGHILNRTRPRAMGLSNRALQTTPLKPEQG